jgi:hypothetical protein
MAMDERGGSEQIERALREGRYAWLKNRKRVAGAALTTRFHLRPSGIYKRLLIGRLTGSG